MRILLANWHTVGARSKTGAVRSLPWDCTRRRRMCRVFFAQGAARRQKHAASSTAPLRFRHRYQMLSVNSRPGSHARGSGGVSHREASHGAATADTRSVCAHALLVRRHFLFRYVRRLSKFANVVDVLQISVICWIAPKRSCTWAVRTVLQSPPSSKHSRCFVSRDYLPRRVK